MASRGVCYPRPTPLSLGLSAPAAVPVEISAPDRRVFRLTTEIGVGGLQLESPAPFEPGRPVSLRFALPGSPIWLGVEARLEASGDPDEEGGERGGTTLYFLDPQPEIRDAVTAYVVERLGLPPLP